jgi:hypothetical protein
MVSRYDLVVYAVVGMPQDVTHPAKSSPVDVWAKPWGVFPQANGGLGENLQLALDRRTGLHVPQIVIEAHHTYEFADQSDALLYVKEVVASIPKRQ